MRDKGKEFRIQLVITIPKDAQASTRITFSSSPYTSTCL